MRTLNLEMHLENEIYGESGVGMGQKEKHLDRTVSTGVGVITVLLGNLRWENL